MKMGFEPRGRLDGVPGSDEAVFREVLRLASGRPVFTADYYLLDSSSQKVLAFVDWNDPTHLLIQTDTAKQVRPPQPHADYRGRLCGNFTGAELYVSNRANASWDYLINGDCSESILFTQTGGTGVNKILVETGSARSHEIFIKSDNLNVQLGIFRASSNLTVAAKAALNVPQQLSAYVTTAVSPNIYVKCTGQSAVTTASLPGSSSTTDGPYQWGGRVGSGVFGFVGRVAVLGVYTPSHAALPPVQTALATLYGVAA